MFNLAGAELYRLFLSPFAWVVLGLYQLILAYLFLTHIDYFLQIQGQISAVPGAPGVTEMIAIPVLNNAAIILLLIAPLITMRMIAEERRNETLPLLYSSPLSISQIVLGKYIGTFLFFFSIVLLTLLMPLSLTAGSSIDFYQLAAALVGLLLILASFTAIGLYLSSLTRQPVIAAISTFACLFLLWIIDWAGNLQMTDSSSSVLGWLSLLRHFEPMLQGEISTTDLTYFVLLIISFLVLTIQKLDSERWQ